MSYEEWSRDYTGREWESMDSEKIKQMMREFFDYLEDNPIELEPPASGMLSLSEAIGDYKRPWWAIYDVPDSVLEEANALIGQQGGTDGEG